MRPHLGDTVAYQSELGPMKRANPQAFHPAIRAVIEPAAFPSDRRANRPGGAVIIESSEGKCQSVPKCTEPCPAVAVTRRIINNIARHPGSSFPVFLRCSTALRRYSWDRPGGAPDGATVGKETTGVATATKLARASGQGGHNVKAAPTSKSASRLSAGERICLGSGSSKPACKSLA